MAWEFEELSRWFREGRIHEHEVLDQFEYGQPDFTPMALLEWLIFFQMTGMGAILLRLIADRTAFSDFADTALIRSVPRGKANRWTPQGLEVWDFEEDVETRRAKRAQARRAEMDVGIARLFTERDARAAARYLDR